MAVSYSREELGRGISLTRIYDKKFKSNCVKIAFISPLDEKTACVNAMLQTVLVTSNAEIPSRTKLTSTLTGISKFSQLSIFSELNNLKILTFSARRI